MIVCLVVLHGKSREYFVNPLMNDIKYIVTIGKQKNDAALNTNVSID